MPIDRAKALSLIEASVNELNQFREDGEKVVFHEELVLFGQGSNIDSLDLVSIITDVEEALADEFDLDLSLTDDRALAHIPSPFDSVGNLASFIVLASEEGVMNGS